MTSNNSDFDMQTPDWANENARFIAERFPNCVTETAKGIKIDFDLLQQELSSDLVSGFKERYRLEWPGKRQAIVTANLPTTNTLRPVRADSVNFDTTQNLYIEGDNLEVLKLLQESYLNKVKMIYIDPPYNTGKDFVYKDDFRQDSEEYKEESGFTDEYNQRLKVNPDTAGRYHSNWLSMMYPRLKLARNLLKEDGVIFISIDDNEAHNLRKICDEIFGEENFIGQISRATGTPTGQGTVGMVSEIDFILAFSKSSLFGFIGLPFSKEDGKIYNKKDSIGRYLTRPLRKTGGEDKREDRPSMFFSIEAPNGEDVFPFGPGGYESRWRCSKNKYNEFLKNNLIEWKEVSEGGVKIWKPYLKFYLEGRKKSVSNLWNNLEGNKKASIDIKNLFDSKVFDFPKPIELLKICIKVSSAAESIILDFFSGSATTAHAVMQLNAEDGGKRKHIQVQLPELTDEKSEAHKAGYKNICEIGKERIRRAGKKIVEEQKDKIADLQRKLEKVAEKLEELQQANLTIAADPKATALQEEQQALQQQIEELQSRLEDLDIGFRVFRLDSSNLNDVFYRPQDYRQDQLDIFTAKVKEDRSDEDLLVQVLLDWGLPLSLSIEQTRIGGKRLFKVAGNSLYACFEKMDKQNTQSGIDDDFVIEIAKDAPMRVVFGDRSFKDDTAKSNAKQLLKQLSPETEMKVI